jgi:signal transduction histidine kinase
VATATGISGWLVAGGLGVLLLRLRGRSERVAEAAHELRGPVAAFSYAVASLSREPGGVRRASRFEAELERMRAGLADLEAARAGAPMPLRPQTLALEAVVHGSVVGWSAAVSGADRGVTVRWEAGTARVIADRRRLSQAFGNLLANAVEHGSGPIEVHAVRGGPQTVRVEVRDGGPTTRPGRRRGGLRSGRGHGLRIARRAIAAAGGTVELQRGRLGTMAAVELPLVADEAAR